jgi:beta-glucosidase
MKRLIQTIIICALLSPIQSIFAQQADNATVEQRVEQLIKKMTLKEKIGQLNQISSSGNINEMGAQVRAGMISSILNEIDVNRVNQLQRIAVKESRLGIPLLIARDVIHGFKTIFPIPLGQAASFDTEVVKRGARIAAVESAACGIRWTFAPMIDIARDPRWGRIAESCGEDTYLTSVMGRAMIEGFQGDKLSDASSIAACPKHFVGYGAAEGGRDYNSTYIPERRLRNVYLPPFEEAVKAGAATFMSSFNANDGVPSTGNKFILRDILRNEWNFNGFVCSDWTSIYEMMIHGFAADGKEAAEKAINAGVDMDMVSGQYSAYLDQLIAEGKVTTDMLDNAVRNILRIKFQLGLFDHPYVDTKHAAKPYAAENLAAAKQAALESAILLKNENQVLPLNDSIHTVAIVGPMADAPYEQMGTWTFDGDKNHTQTPLAAIKAIYGSRVKIIYEPALGYSRDLDKSNIYKAVEAAKQADVVLAFIGEEAILSGEAHCLADLSLQGAQSQLIEALSKTGKPIVTVVMAGRPLSIGKEVAESTAVLYQFHPGTMGGPAIADLLWGKAVPSGKTPVTFPQSVGQIPVYYAQDNTGRPATRHEILLKDIPVNAGQTSLGCKSYYLDAGFDPLFPFGYGLSYSKFVYSDIHLASNELSKDDVLKVTFNLKNEGDYEATEVAQLYIQDVVGSVVRPVKELKRFARITLKPGESRICSFELPVSELAFYNLDMKKVVEPGDFRLWVATDSQSGLPVSFRVK